LSGIAVGSVIAQRSRAGRVYDFGISLDGGLFRGFGTVYVRIERNCGCRGIGRVVGYDMERRGWALRAGAGGRENCSLDGRAALVWDVRASRWDYKLIHHERFDG